jgi:hypothetical protein
MYDSPFDIFDKQTLQINQAKLNVKISFCIFLNPSAYSEDARKVVNRQGKYCFLYMMQSLNMPRVILSCMGGTGKVNKRVW